VKTFLSGPLGRFLFVAFSEIIVVLHGEQYDSVLLPEFLNRVEERPTS
jgi:hypothetical protein